MDEYMNDFIDQSLILGQPESKNLLSLSDPTTKDTLEHPTMYETIEHMPEQFNLDLFNQSNQSLNPYSEATALQSLDQKLNLPDLSIGDLSNIQLLQNEPVEGMNNGLIIDTMSDFFNQGSFNYGLDLPQFSNQDSIYQYIGLNPSTTDNLPLNTSINTSDLIASVDTPLTNSTLYDVSTLQYPQKSLKTQELYPDISSYQQGKNNLANLAPKEIKNEHKTNIKQLSIKSKGDASTKKQGETAKRPKRSRDNIQIKLEDVEDSRSDDETLNGNSNSGSNSFRITKQNFPNLSSKEVRQLRNKESARSFRARRKEYLNSLEVNLGKAKTEIHDLKQRLTEKEKENHSLKNEIDELRLKLESILVSGPSKSDTKKLTELQLDVKNINQQSDLMGLLPIDSSVLTETPKPTSISTANVTLPISTSSSQALIPNNSMIRCSHHKDMGKEGSVSAGWSSSNSYIVVKSALVDYKPLADVEGSGVGVLENVDSCLSASVDKVLSDNYGVPELPSSETIIKIYSLVVYLSLQQLFGEIISKIVVLSIFLAIGFLLCILSCALYGNWLPSISILLFVLIPVPNGIFGRFRGDDIFNETASSLPEIGKFLTSIVMVSAIALPIVLCRAGTIEEQAMVMCTSGGFVVYLTVSVYGYGNVVWAVGGTLVEVWERVFLFVDDFGASELVERVVGSNGGTKSHNANERVDFRLNPSFGKTVHFKWSDKRQEGKHLIYMFLIDEKLTHCSVLRIFCLSHGTILGIIKSSIHNTTHKNPTHPHDSYLRTRSKRQLLYELPETSQSEYRKQIQASILSSFSNELAPKSSPLKTPQDTNNNSPFTRLKKDAPNSRFPSRNSSFLNPQSRNPSFLNAPSKPPQFHKTTNIKKLLNPEQQKELDLTILTLRQSIDSETDSNSDEMEIEDRQMTTPFHSKTGSPIIPKRGKTITSSIRQFNAQNQLPKFSKLEELETPKTKKLRKPNQSLPSTKTSFKDSKNPPQTSPEIVRESRFHIIEQVVIGNESRFIPTSKRKQQESNNTHIWTLYVRKKNKNSILQNFIKKVRVFLHPSYRPNDIVDIIMPPFELSRLGWGEFPVRIQIFFIDKRNKPVNLVHILKLDDTFSGNLMPGREQVIDLELNKTLENSSIDTKNSNHIQTTHTQQNILNNASKTNNTSKTCTKKTSNNTKLNEKSLTSPTDLENVPIFDLVNKNHKNITSPNLHNTDKNPQHENPVSLDTDNDIEDFGILNDSYKLEDFLIDGFQPTENPVQDKNSISTHTPQEYENYDEVDVLESKSDIEENNKSNSTLKQWQKPIKLKTLDSLMNTIKNEKTLTKQDQEFKKPYPKYTKTPKETIIDSKCDFGEDEIIYYIPVQKTAKKHKNGIICRLMDLLANVFPLVDNKPDESKEQPESKKQGRKKSKIKASVLPYAPAKTQEIWENEWLIGHKLRVENIRAKLLLSDIKECFEGSSFADPSIEIDFDLVSDPDELLSCVMELLDKYNVSDNQIDSIVHDILIASPEGLIEAATEFRYFYLYRHHKYLALWLKEFGYGNLSKISVPVTSTKQSVKDNESYDYNNFDFSFENDANIIHSDTKNDNTYSLENIEAEKVFEYIESLSKNEKSVNLESSNIENQDLNEKVLELIHGINESLDKDLDSLTTNNDKPPILEGFGSREIQPLECKETVSELNEQKILKPKKIDYKFYCKNCGVLVQTDIQSAVEKVKETIFNNNFSGNDDTNLETFKNALLFCSSSCMSIWFPLNIPKLEANDTSNKMVDYGKNFGSFSTITKVSDLFGDYPNIFHKNKDIYELTNKPNDENTRFSSDELNGDNDGVNIGSLSSDMQVHQMHLGIEEKYNGGGSKFENMDIDGINGNGGESDEEIVVDDFGSSMRLNMKGETSTIPEDPLIKLADEIKLSIFENINNSFRGDKTEGNSDGLSNFCEIDADGIDWVWDTIRPFELAATPAVQPKFKSTIASKSVRESQNNSNLYGNYTENVYSDEEVMEQRVVVGDLLYKLAKCFIQRLVKSSTEIVLEKVKVYEETLDQSKDKESSGDTNVSNSSLPRAMLLPTHLLDVLKNNPDEYDFIINMYMGDG
ncbi:hypothetical protein BB558_003430 [Smittium angustum]|uniref:Uncharacterized protein n=1 Tax=Smittium angustum TaxID=133377 RepID=A0A2U1J620_SMIAN|nr:hypothetical protein BB558_003430 [Smittium angustum]